MNWLKGDIHISSQSEQACGLTLNPELIVLDKLRWTQWLKIILLEHALAWPRWQGAPDSITATDLHTCTCTYISPHINIIIMYAAVAVTGCGSPCYLGQRVLVGYYSIWVHTSGFNVKPQACSDRDDIPPLSFNVLWTMFFFCWISF